MRPLLALTQNTKRVTKSRLGFRPSLWIIDFVGELRCDGFVKIYRGQKRIVVKRFPTKVAKGNGALTLVAPLKLIVVGRYSCSGPVVLCSALVFPLKVRKQGVRFGQRGPGCCVARRLREKTVRFLQKPPDFGK